MNALQQIIAFIRIIVRKKKKRVKEKITQRKT
jgi:hypothetical protein